jgi:hypothetical protein
MKVLHHILLLATATLVESEPPVLEFEDTDGTQCTITKAGLKLGLNTGCCYEDECSTALADRVTETETAIAANLAAANLAIAALQTSTETAIAELQTEQAALRSSLETQGTASSEIRNLVCPPAMDANQVHSLSGARTATNGICKYDCAADHHDADIDGSCVRCKVATDCGIGELFDGTTCGTDVDTTCTPCTNKPDASATYTMAGSCQFSTLAPTAAPTVFTGITSELDGGGWTQVWKHAYGEVCNWDYSCANHNKYKTYSSELTLCTTSAKYCNLPNKAQFANRGEQMIVAYHNGVVQYAYKGGFNAQLDVSWQGADFVPKSSSVKIVDRCTSSAGTPPEPVSPSNSYASEGLTFDKHNYGTHTLAAGPPAQQPPTARLEGIAAAVRPACLSVCVCDPNTQHPAPPPLHRQPARQLRLRPLQKRQRQ